MLKYNIKMLNRIGRGGLDLSGLGWGLVKGFCEYGNETSEFHKMIEIS
jgi:hypothetical protein